MIIYAAEKFHCRHRYVATTEGDLLLFVCDRCHHRTELLPLDMGTRTRAVVRFPVPDHSSSSFVNASDRQRAGTSPRHAGMSVSDGAAEERPA
jgi:hypothetical protein